MKKPISIALSIAAFFTVYVGVKEIKKHFEFQKALEGASVETAKKAIEELKNANEKTADGQSVMQLLKEDSNKKFNENIKSTKSDWEKASASASNFYGYYLMNVEGRKEYCEKNNVSISYFVKTFSDANQSYFYAATKILEKDFEQNNTKFSYQMMKELVGGTLKPVVAQDMLEVKKQMNLNDAQACELFNEKAKEFVNAMAYEKQNKIGSELLLNAK